MTTLAHRRRDWLDVLRGELPSMVPRRECDARHLLDTYVVAVARGLLVGAVTGASCGALIVIRYPPGLVLAVPIGGIVGGLVALVPSVVLAAAITALIAFRHEPVLDLRRLHREAWLVLLAGVGLLDALALSRASDERAALLLLVPTAIVLVLLRWAARRIVVAHARVCGWIEVD